MSESRETNWGAEPARAPSLAEGDNLIYSEHGRVLDNVCYRSHWLCLVRAQFGGYYLLVKHGGGQERFQIAYSKRMVQALENIDSDSRYFLLHSMLKINHDAARNASEATSARYRAAFVNGTLRKRKQRGGNAFKVWIERPNIFATSSQGT